MNGLCVAFQSDQSKFERVMCFWIESIESTFEKRRAATETGVRDWNLSRESWMVMDLLPAQSNRIAGTPHHDARAHLAELTPARLFRAAHDTTKIQIDVSRAGMLEHQSPVTSSSPSLTLYDGCDH